MTGAEYMVVLRALAGESVLVLTALVVLTVDLARGRHLALAARRQTAGSIALLGLALAAMTLVPQISQSPVALLGGTVVMSPLSVIFKYVIIVLAAVTVLISIDHELGTHVGEYFSLMLFGVVGMLLLVGTEELLMLFVALELTSLSLYILTAFHKTALRSQEAALKYFLFGAISSAFLLLGFGYVYGLTGSTNLNVIGTAVVRLRWSPLMAAAVVCLLVGFGFKLAVVPFHLWAPDAYEGAPTPVTALIATGSKVASVFVLLKVMFVGFGTAVGAALWGATVPGWGLVLAVVAVASMLLGNLAAIVQTNVKRLLAYSSIAHGGYILIGFIAARTSGATAVLFYVLVYALTNLGAFGVVAVLAGRVGGDRLSDFDGMARRAPFLSLTMLIFVLSLAGVPPLGGFFGKFYLFAAAIERDTQQFGLAWLVALGIAMSAVSLYYYLIVMKHFYVLPAKDDRRLAVPVYLQLALGLVAAGVLGLGLFPGPIVALLKTLLHGL